MNGRTRPSEVAQALPTPEGNRWGVSLALRGGGSDKEYRIVVNGTRTVLQWGAARSAGQVKVVDHVDHVGAAQTARRQWAAKEAKGYWPTSGIVPLAPGVNVSSTRYGPHDAINEGYKRAAERLSRSGPGEELWLCQLPTWQSPAPGPSLAGTLAQQGLLVGSGRSGGYALLRVGAAAAGDLAAACPIAVSVGRVSDASAAVVAEVAETLWKDASDGGSHARTALAAALEMAKLLV